MAEAKGADQQAGDDLVANAEHGDRVKHAVAERDRGRQGDDVAAEEGQIHARLALGDAVAHRRDAAGDLGRRPRLAGENLDLLGIAPIGLMRRQHVVEGGDDTDVRALEPLDGLLVLAGRGEAVGEIAAAQAAAVDPARLLLGHQVEVAAARRPRALDDALGHSGESWVRRHHSCHSTPSRVASAVAAGGPQLPGA